MLQNSVCSGVRRPRSEFFVRRWGIIAVARLALGCSNEPALVCESAPEEKVGEWSVRDGPTYEHYALGERPISGMYGSDGSELVLLQQDCFECELVFFGGKSQAWVSMNAERTSPLVVYSYISVSEGHIVSLAEGNGLALLNRSSLSWTQIERPTDIPDRQTKGWTGQEFAYWGAAKNLSGSQQLTPETPYRRYYDGVFLNPETLEWTLIPPLREPYEFPYGEGGPTIVSVWTRKGLFVWGTNPERTANFGAIFDRASMKWTELKGDGDLPPLREGFRLQLLATSDAVYLFSGNEPGEEEPSRRIFEYSLDAGTWREVAVPEWVDPMRGTVLDEKLVFMGGCAGGARFDPKTETWVALAKDGPPPTQGSLLGFGNSLAVIGAEDHPVVSGRVWILDLGE